MEDYYIVAIHEAESNYDERIRLEELRDASNPFSLSETKFQKLFRLPKSGAMEVMNLLDGPSLNHGHIPKHLKVLIALKFMAHGSYQSAVGQDNLLAVSQPTVSRCLEVVVKNILTKLTPSQIKFPTTANEKAIAKAEFLDLYNMPNTLGAIDGTHVAISKPPISHPTAPGSLFYNRKGFYSINCQIVCSAKGRIIAFNPNFPGSTHDAAIWRASKIYNFLKNEFIRGVRNQWLLGDKGYPLQPWLMTPLIAATTPAEEAYNSCHIRARNVVEMVNGRLKNKFRCLHRHRCLHYSPEKAAGIIVACCTLYNMFKDVLSDDDNDVEEEVPVIPMPQEEHDDTDFLAEARHIQNILINTQFN